MNIEKTIRRIAHMADIHVPKLHRRHNEFREVFAGVYDGLRQTQPDRIVIVGDIFHDKLNISNETQLLVGDFLETLSNIAPLRITRGNHDIDMVKAQQRLDCIETVVGLIDNPNIVYMNKSGFHVDENIIWVVWHHGDHYSPWNQLDNLDDPTKLQPNCQLGYIAGMLSEHGSVENIRAAGYKFIDLYHDPIKGCKMFNGMTLEKDSYLSLNDFKGDHLMMGDIHLRATFNKA